jgi:hypothetical protein
MDLQSLTGEDFRARLDQPFKIRLANGQEYALVLVSVTETGAPPQTGARRPFSLVFNNPRKDAFLPQQTYLLSEAVLGDLEIFLVPLGADARGMRYEAVFS